MASSSLIAHCGARTVGREELLAVKAPEPTRTWFPLSHSAVLQTVKDKLREGGFVVEKEQLALGRHDARFFGTLDLASAIAPGVSLAVGIRNSLDKSNAQVTVMLTYRAFPGAVGPDQVVSTA